MSPRPSDEIEGSRNIALPVTAIDDARAYAEAAGVTMRGYIDGAHTVMYQLGQAGVGPETRICTPEGLAPLPRLQASPEQPTRAVSIIIGKRLLEQSYDYRHSRNLSVAQYVGRTVLLMNGLFQLNVGPRLRLDRTIPAPHRTIIPMPFEARIQK